MLTILVRGKSKTELERMVERVKSWFMVYGSWFTGYEKMAFFSSPMRAAEPMIPEPGSCTRYRGTGLQAPGLYGCIV